MDNATTKEARRSTSCVSARPTHDNNNDDNMQQLVLLRSNGVVGPDPPPPIALTPPSNVAVGPLEDKRRRQT
jgi:hypothetical protein